MFRTADQLRRMAEACREALAAATDAQERAQIAAKLQALSDLASNEDWLAGRASQTAAPLTARTRRHQSWAIPFVIAVPPRR